MSACSVPARRTLPPAVSAMLDKAVDAYIPVVVDRPQFAVMISSNQLAFELAFRYADFNQHVRYTVHTFLNSIGYLPCKPAFAEPLLVA